MKDTRLIMGMPITVEVIGGTSLEDVFAYFVSVDERFSTYKEASEITKINRGEITEADYSSEMKDIFALAEKTKKETGGYFDIKKPDGSLDPSGIVKGWAIQTAAEILRKAGYQNFFVDAGGDIQPWGLDGKGNAWSVGIRNPFNQGEIVKVIYPRGSGVATSGNYIRGNHIYNPLSPAEIISDTVSITVIGPNVLEADRFATAAFAMGSRGIHFIETLPGFEAYAIDSAGLATMTSGFQNYL